MSPHFYSTDEEVEKARAGILNSFVFNSDSTLEILNQQLTYEYYGYPLDWQQRYRAGIEKVTTAQVREAAKKYVFPDKFAIVVVGDRKTIEPGIRALNLGAIKELALDDVFGK